MRKSILVKKICYCVALVCLVIGVITTFSAMSMVKKAEKTRGTISTIQEDITYESDGNVIQYYPEIEYTDPATGEEMIYTSGTSIGKNKYAVGDTVDLLLVQKDGELDIRIYTSMTPWTGLIVMGIMALLFAMIGFVFDLNRMKKDKLMNSLKATGKKIEVPIIEIRKEVTKSRSNAPVHMSITFYVIYAQWMNSEGREFVFKSENIARHPSEFGKDVGAPVTVYFDATNPARHYIDLSFVPQKDLF